MNRMRWISLLVLLGALLGGFVVAPIVAAQPVTLAELPPGIARQAEPLLAAMMARMEQMQMPPEEMAMMMADMQALVESLPPGIWLQVFELMLDLDPPEMMALHMEIGTGGLLQQPPGRVLAFVRGLTR